MGAGGAVTNYLDGRVWEEGAIEERGSFVAGFDYSYASGRFKSHGVRCCKQSPYSNAPTVGYGECQTVREYANRYPRGGDESAAAPHAL